MLVYLHLHVDDTGE